MDEKSLQEVRSKYAAFGLPDSQKPSTMKGGNLTQTIADMNYANRGYNDPLVEDLETHQRSVGILDHLNMAGVAVNRGMHGWIFDTLHYLKVGHRVAANKKRVELLEAGYSTDQVLEMMGPTQDENPEQFTEKHSNIYSYENLTEDYRKKSRPIQAGIEFAGGGFGISAIGRAATKKFTKEMSEEALKRSHKIDNTLNTASGLGAAAASYASGGNEVAELLGGVAAPGVYLTKHLTTAVGKGLSNFNKKFSKPAMEKVSVKAILQHAHDPEKAILELERAIASNKTGSLGQLTGDKGILGIEKKMQEGNSEFAGLIKNLDGETLKEVTTLLSRLRGEVDNVEALTHEYFKAVAENGSSMIRNEIDEVAKSYRSTLEVIGEGDKELASVRLFDDLNKTYDNVLAIEKELWESLPDVEVDVGDTFDYFNEYQKLVLDTAIEQSPKVRAPFKDAVRVLEDLSETGIVNVKEIVKLRSDVLATLRWIGKTDSKIPPASKAYGSALQKTLRKVLNEAGSISPRYAAAAAYTKEMHEVFDPLLFQGKAVDAAEFGSRVMAPGNKGAKQLDSMAWAYGYDQGLVGGVEDVIKANFVDSAVRFADDGSRTLDVVAAQRFATKHAGSLRRYPQIQAAIAKSITEGKVLKELDTELKSTVSEIQKARYSLYTEYSDPRRALEKLVLSPTIKNPQANAKELMDLAKKDPTGDAVLGLKRTAIDVLANGILKESYDGSKFLSKAYRDAWTRSKPVIDEFFKDDPQSKEVLKVVFDDLEKLATRSTADNVNIGFDKSVIISAVGAIAGARVGAKIGTTPLIAAGIGRRIAVKVLDTVPNDKRMALLEDMLINPNKFKSVYDELGGDAIQEADLPRLWNGWLALAGIRQTDLILENQVDEERRKAEYDKNTVLDIEAFEAVRRGRANVEPPKSRSDKVKNYLDSIRR